MRNLDTPDARSNLFGMLSLHQGKQYALEWLDTSGSSDTKLLTALGWKNAAALLAEAGRWEEAAARLQALPEHCIVDCPDIPFVEGFVNAALTLPLFVRARVLTVQIFDKQIGYEPHPSCGDCPLTARSRPKKSGQNIPKNRCRTTIPERMVETPAELPFIGDQVVCLSHDQAGPRPQSVWDKPRCVGQHSLVFVRRVQSQEPPMRIRPIAISAAFAIALATLPLSTADAQSNPPQSNPPQYYPPCSPFPLAWPFCVVGAVLGVVGTIVTAPIWLLTGAPPPFGYYGPPYYPPPPPPYYPPPNYYAPR